VPTSRSLTPAGLVLSDRPPGAGEALQLAATVVNHDGAVLVTVSRHLEYNAPADDELVVTVAGDLDQDTAPLVEIALTTALEQHRRVCLDLRDVTFFGAAGANTVVAAHLHAARTGGRLTLRGVPGIVRQVLKITRLDQLLANRV
jgi:anti-anti-sigma factor